MGTVPEGWEVVKPSSVPDGWEVIGKHKVPGDELGDTAAITAGAFTQGAREGGNPLGILEGIVRLANAIMPTANPVVGNALKALPTDELADWAGRNKASIDPIRAYESPQGTMAAEALKSLTGLDPRTDLANTAAAYKATGAEKTPLREALSAAARTVGATLPSIGIPGMATGAGMKSIAGAALGAGTGRALGGDTGEIIGTLAGGFAGPAIASTTRGVLGGGTTKAAETLRDFERAGTTPSMGQMTGKYTLSAAESTTGRFGAPVHMQRFGETQAAQMGERAEQIASKFAPPMDSETIGRYVRTGITGKGGFIEKTQDKANKLYADVDKYAPPDTPMVMANTIAYLNQATANPRNSGIVAAASEEATKRLGPYLEGIKQDLSKGAGNGSLRFDDARLALTRVGKKIDQGIVNGDVTVKEAKQLYAAMSEDVRQSLPGSALRAWERASSYWSARMTRLEDTLVPLVESKTPERIITALDRSAREGSTTIRTVYKSLEPETRNMLTAANIRELGRATPGVQNAEGTIFSPAQFVSRWNRIDESAKRIMFDGNGQRDLRFALDSFARAADAIKKGSTVLQNKSGTAAAVYNLGAWVGGPAGGGVLGSLIAGAPGAAAGAAGSFAVMNRLGHLMTNPAAVRWLARSTSVDAQTWAAQGTALASRLNDPEMKAAIQDLLNQGGQR